MNDHDDLDRALAALPLEEPSAGFHTRLMAATVYRPRAVVAQWEVWLIASVAAVAVWLASMVLSAPHASERLSDGVLRLVQAGGLTSLSTLLWLAVGVSAAWWLSQISVPARRRIEIR